VFSGSACRWAFVAAKFRLVQYLADIFKLPPGTHSPESSRFAAGFEWKLL
jgi:hypothetical protein